MLWNTKKRAWFIDSRYTSINPCFDGSVARALPDAYNEGFAHAFQSLF